MASAYPSSYSTSSPPGTGYPTLTRSGTTTSRRSSTSSSRPPTRNQLQRQEAEARELSLIMDESYLPRTSLTLGYDHHSQYGYGNRNSYDSGRTRRSRTLSVGGWYPNAVGGVVHDIDHRPFPPIVPPPERRATLGDVGVGRPRTSSPPAYWETFSLPYVEEPESDSEMGVSSERYNDNWPSTHTYTRTRSATYGNAYAYAYVDNTTRYAINEDERGEPVVKVDARGRRVLAKKKVSGKGKDKDDRDDGEEEEVQEGGRKAERERKATMSPKEKLHQTWVATRFGMELKMIRTQRWLRERVQGQGERQE